MLNESYSTSPSRAVACRALLWLSPFIPAVVLAFHIVHVWVNIPFHDDWWTPGHQLVELCQGKLGFAGWFEQHNESRPFFPRLIFIPLAWFGGWDVRRVICTIFAMVCVMSLLTRGLVRRMPGISQAGVAMISLGINFVLFWPHSEIWIYANTLMLVFPPVALLCAVHVNLSGMPLRGKVLWNSLLATIATYSWSNGLLLWALALPIPGEVFFIRWPANEKKQMRWYLFYMGAMIVNLLFYFHGYQRPVDNPPLSWDIPRLAGYFFTLIGGFFGNEEMAQTIGVCACILYLALAVTCMAAGFRKRDLTACHPWLVLGKYAVLSGAVAAIGRSGFGDSQAMSPRYTAVTGFFYIAMIGMGCLLWQELRKKLPQTKMRIAKLLTAGTVVLCVCFAFQSYRNGFQTLKDIGEHRQALLMAWQWSKAMPANPLLPLLVPDMEVLDNSAETLETHQILRVPRLEPGVTSHWNYDFRAANVANGVFSSCGIASDGWLDVSGWAGNPDQSGPADCVLLTVSKPGGGPRPWTVLPANLHSPDVASALKNKRMGRSAFRMGIPMMGLPKGRLTFYAWAVDVKQAVIRPLARGFVVENR